MKSDSLSAYLAILRNSENIKSQRIDDRLLLEKWITWTMKNGVLSFFVKELISKETFIHGTI